MELTTRFQCSVCGTLTGRRVIQNRDGMFCFPRYHASLHGNPCPGIFEEATEVKVPSVQKPIRPA